MHRFSTNPHIIPQVQPVIAEILRTCVYPQTLNLRIENVTRIKQTNDSEDSDKPSRFATKLFLTDGKLVIQALLHRKLNTLPEIVDLKKGDIVKIREFLVKKAKRRNGKGHVVYLGIDDCCVIKERLQRDDLTGVTQTCNGQELDEFNVSGGFFHDDNVDLVHADKSACVKEVAGQDEHNPSAEQDQPPKIISEQQNAADDSTNHVYGKQFSPHNLMKRKFAESNESESDEEAFETLIVDKSSAEKRRKVLHELSQNISPSRPPTRESHVPMHEEMDVPDRKTVVKFRLDENKSEKEATSNDNQQFKSMQDGGQPGPTELLTRASRPTTPNLENVRWGPLHSLLSLYSPSLPSKSYVFTTLVIPTYVASHLISRPNSPFPPKRHIKVVDPSLAAKMKFEQANLLGKGITVSVYRDSQNFKPSVGRVALMRGVVMQRLKGTIKNMNGSTNQEVILNVYSESRTPQSQNQSTEKANEIEDQKLVEQRRILDEPIFSEKDPNDSEMKPGPMDVMGNGVEVHHNSSDVEWYIDDHDLLRQRGYQVDAFQSWWDRMNLAYDWSRDSV